MPTVIPLDARWCLTASGFVFNAQGHVLLVLHKHLNMWLTPGGHLEPNEKPHDAALREIVEETGVHARIIAPYPYPPQFTPTVYHPVPLLTNSHWISPENYAVRKKAKLPPPRDRNPQLPMKGCEAHMVFSYLCVAEGGDNLQGDPKENNDIGWFDPANLEKNTQRASLHPYIPTGCQRCLLA